MTADRTFSRALGMYAALTRYPNAAVTDQRKIAEDIAAVIEAFATEPPVIASASPKTESAEHELTS